MTCSHSSRLGVCDRCGLQVNEMAPWLMSGKPRPVATSSVPGVDVGAFVGTYGSILLVASNTLGEPVPSVALTAEVRVPVGATARLLFGSSYREVPFDSTGEQINLSDTIDAMGTRVYMIMPHGLLPLPTVTTDASAPNLIFNGDLEFATTVGQPDGWSAAWGTDPAATNSHDASVAPPGLRHSLRLTTPVVGAGLRAWSYPIKANMTVGEEYTLSLQARGGDAGQNLTIGLEALFGHDAVPCPGTGVPDGQCSYTPQPLRLELNTWTRHELTAKCRFQPDQTGYFGAAGMVSIELISAGVAWIADVRLHRRGMAAVAPMR